MENLYKYENYMTLSVGMVATCNACDRMIKANDKYFDGGYCQDCKDQEAKEIECEFTDTFPPQQTNIFKP